MRFIVDESTGMAVIEYLRQANHDVLAVSESMPQADDTKILSRAASLRLRDESSISRVHMIRSVIEKYADQLQGHFVIATERVIRVR